MTSSIDGVASVDCCHQTMPLGTRCEGCPLAKPGDKLVPRRNVGVKGLPDA
jgi:hypothetical protein